MFIWFYGNEQTAFEVTISVHVYRKLVGCNVAENFLLFLHSRKVLLKILHTFSRSVTLYQFRGMK
jgi:hypothetical protein